MSDSKPTAWLREQRGAFEGPQTLDPLFVLGDFRPRNFLHGATYEPLYPQSAIDAQAAEIERLRAACTNARDMLSTDRQAFVDSNRLRDGRTDDPIAHGLNLVDEDTWITAEDAECVRDYDRAIALIDAALTPQQPAPSAQRLKGHG